MIARRMAHVLVAATAAFMLTQTGAEAQQLRMRWQDFISGPDGARRLASLEAAVSKMKSLDATDPVQDPVNYRRSWHYWANIHGYYGSQSPDGTVQQQIDYLKANGFAQDVKYYDGSADGGPPITDQTPPDDIARMIWATCEHGDDANFFGWHRMYLYYFERVVRWAANDDTLRLPYWDYTDPAQEALPAAFQDVASVLYDPKRQPSINNGSGTLDPNTTNVNDALKEPDYHTYENKIQDGIHGYVHCTVGPTCPVAHMGDVPVAGNDSVFYHHHANIDRLWACWQQANMTPSGPWQDQMFSFVDETGALVTRPVKDFLDSTTLGYVYDNVISCTRPVAVGLIGAATAQTAAPRPPVTTMAKVHGTESIAIRTPTTSVNLNVPPAPLASLFANVSGPAAKVQLVLRDITADSHPGTMFNVYLAKTANPEDRRYVGTLSWFSDFSRRHQGHGGGMTKTLTFDVTDQLRALGGGTTGAGLTTVIEATNGVVSDNPVTFSTLRAAASNSFQAGANLRIGSIELHAAR